MIAGAQRGDAAVQRMADQFFVGQTAGAEGNVGDLESGPTKRDLPPNLGLGALSRNPGGLCATAQAYAGSTSKAQELAAIHHLSAAPFLP